MVLRMTKAMIDNSSQDSAIAYGVSLALIIMGSRIDGLTEWRINEFTNR